MGPWRRSQEADDLWLELPYDQVTLDAVAEAAGVAPVCIPMGRDQNDTAAG